MSSFKFSKVSIVESLKPKDKKTGQLLYDQLDMFEVFHQKGLKLELNIISTRLEFENLLDLLTKNAHDFSEIPILQIEAHGSEDKLSMVLNSGETISWYELEEILRTLNLATKCNLLLVMSTCFGAYASMAISLTNRAPFWGIIGPETTVYPDEIIGSLTNFYSHLYQGKDGSELVKALELNQSQILKFLTSEWFFVKAYVSYVKNFCNEQATLQAAESFSQKLSASGVVNLPELDLIKQAIRPHGKEFFEKLMRHFFMIDLFPENENKISVIYEQIPI